MGDRALGRSLGWAAGGAAATFLFDPQLGRRRRRLLRDRALGASRRGARRALRLERHVQSTASGHLTAALHRRRRPRDYDDVTLAHKVESLLYRDPLVPKGRLNIDACEGVVTVRGLVDDQVTIDRVVEDVRRVQGVRGVENLLHLPGTPPPNLDGGGRVRVPASQEP